MKSIEQVVVGLVEVAEKNGKSAEARAIMKEAPGKNLERKAADLEKLVKPFLESFQESAGGKNDAEPATRELVESFKRNFNFTEKEARIAAGVDVGGSRNNEGIDWNKLAEIKD
jgi:hypothetical protein